MDLINIASCHVLEDFIWRVKQLIFHRVGEFGGILSHPVLVEQFGGHRDHRDHVTHGRQGEIIIDLTSLQGVKQGLEPAVSAKPVHLRNELGREALVDTRAGINAIMTGFRLHLIINRAIIFLNGKVVAAGPAKELKMRHQPRVEDRDWLVVAVGPTVKATNLVCFLAVLAVDSESALGCQNFAATS